MVPALNYHNEDMNITIKFKKNDAWVDAYWNDNKIYICLIPFLPLIIQRHS